MILDNERNYEEIEEIYGGFPLKKNFMEAGNAAIKASGTQARLEDSVIRIPFVDRLLFSEDEYDEYGIDDDFATMKEWRIRAEAIITLDGDPEEGIREAHYEHEVIFPDEDIDLLELSFEYHPTDEELIYGLDLAEDFLNAAIDTNGEEKQPTEPADEIMSNSRCREGYTDADAGDSCESCRYYEDKPEEDIGFCRKLGIKTNILALCSNYEKKESPEGE